MQVCGIDAQTLDAALGNAMRMAQQVADLALQVAHAGLACVVLDDGQQLERR